MRKEQLIIWKAKNKQFHKNKPPLNSNLFVLAHLKKTMSMLENGKSTRLDPLFFEYPHHYCDNCFYSLLCMHKMFRLILLFRYLILYI